MTSDSRAVPVWIRDRLPRDAGDAAALWLAVRLRLPRIGIGFVDWALVARRLGWTAERAEEALRRLEEAGLLFADGMLAWTPGAIEADTTVHLTHHLQRRGILNALERLPERPLVSAFRITYSLDGGDWAKAPVCEPAEALKRTGSRAPPPWPEEEDAAPRRELARPTLGSTLEPTLAVATEDPPVERKTEERFKEGLAGEPNAWANACELEETPAAPGDPEPALAQGETETPREDDFEGTPGLTAEVPPGVDPTSVDNAWGRTGGYGGQVSNRVSNTSKDGNGTEVSENTSTAREAKPARTSKAPPYDAMWEVIREEEMVTRRHRLTAMRRTKLKALWEEQLKAEADPLDLLRRTCQAVKADEWWGARPQTWLPETCWRNTERREKFTLIAEENDVGGDHAGGATGANAGQAGRNRSGAGDRYGHLVSRGGGDAGGGGGG